MKVGAWVKNDDTTKRPLPGDIYFWKVRSPTGEKSTDQTSGKITVVT